MARTKSKSKSDYPEIAKLVVEVAKKRGGNQQITDINWVTKTLFKYQHGVIPLTDTESDCVRIGEGLRPRYTWQITRDHVRAAEQNQAQKGWR
ncbi:MAG TPA: hypothetical protein V6D21_23555 [Candidatus Obscuribacterales bacterium]